MASGAAMDPLLRAQARSRSSGRHRQAKAQVGAARAVMLQAAMPEAVAPHRQAEMAGHVRSWHQWLS
jgi:hypothetical protein